MTTLNLPSGLVGDVRKIRGAEIVAIAEQADGAGDSGGGFARLLNGCWLETLDPGPYSFVAKNDAKPNWARVCKGDLLAGIIFLRRISLTDGDSFDFDVPCEECRTKIRWTVNLSQLPLRELSEESRARLREQRPFELTIYRDGAKHAATFNLATLAQEEVVTKLMKQMKRQTATMVDLATAQIVSIAGVNSGDKKAVWRFLSELSVGELEDMRAEMDEQDCGIETSIEIRCTNRQCGWEQTVNLPLLNGRFFSQKKRRTPKESDGSLLEDFSSDSSEVSPLSGGAKSATTSGGTSTGVPGTGG